MKKIQIDNARILDPENGIDKKGSIFIENGIIAAISKTDKKFNPDLRINAKGKWVCPGIVDLSARFAKPGQEFKSTISTEASAAASAGVTTVCCPPDTFPVIDSPAVVELMYKTAEESGQVQLLPIGALTHGLKGDRLAEMESLKRAGCVAISNANQPVLNNEILRRAFEYAASTDLTVFIHPEDHHLRNQGVINEGAISTRLGLPPIPETAETVALSAALLLVEQTGVCAHFCRLSTARAVDMIGQAKSAGLPVSADAGICHLFLTEMDVDGYNANCHLIPPLRRLEDKDALVNGIIDGTIDAICSDHQPLSIDSKTAPFSLTKPGASTIEFLLPLLIDLATRKKISLLQAIEKISSNPAKVLRLPLGSLSEGKAANITIFDPDKTWTVLGANLVSAGKSTPFDGWELQGKTSHTLLNGVLVYEEKN